MSAIWLLVVALAGLLAGYVIGAYFTMRWLPRILAKMSTSQLAHLAAKTVRYRPADLTPDLNQRTAEAMEAQRNAAIQSLAREQQRYRSGTS